jgi:catechol 2,3-dioxygenase-like lactoylglutathione lyase family enzyme
MAFPADGMELTHILVVDDLERARRWYEDVLGASPYREYGGDSAVLRFLANWLLPVTGLVRSAASSAIPTATCSRSARRLSVPHRDSLGLVNDDREA